ncbi:MAG: beta-ketoacyl-ACP synthase II [Anaerolineae bacterium]
MHYPPRSRVVITGLGVISPLGLNVSDTWEALLAGKFGIALLEDFNLDEYPCRLAARVRDFDPTQYMSPKEARRMARQTQFALAALEEARRQAGLELPLPDPSRLAVSVGSALGGTPIIEEQSAVLHTQGPRRINPTFVPAVLVNMPACQLAIQAGATGPVLTPSAACTTGIVAIGDAFRLLQRGEVDVVIAGGTEAAVSPIALASFGRLGALSTRNSQPELACQPFDAQRDGTVAGEGAAVLILERLEHAQRRGAHILAEVVGYGLTCDAYHQVMPEPTGVQAGRAMALAIQEAGWSPAQVDYICAHGTGTPLNDAAETRAIKQALGEHAYRTAVSSNKAQVGHMLGAAGAFSAVMTVRAMNAGIIPPTANLQNPDPECDLDYVPGAGRPASIRRALVNAFGFGGQNGSLALQVWEG